MGHILRGVQKQLMTSITRVETGIYTAEKNGRHIGSIFSDQPAGGIAQGRHYTASFKPHPGAEGFSFCGSLKACKQWLTDMASVL